MLVVVDQLPSWAFERARPLFTGGFARLLDEGAYVPAATLPYANPFTAPGHATIGTGAAANVHGVLGNSWYRRADGKDRPAEYDLDAMPFAVGPAIGGELGPNDSASGKALRVDGIADELRRAHPAAKSIAIALKARAASFMIGRRPDLAVWYEAAAGGMTTSRAYADEAPRWLVELARAHPVSRWFRETWSARDPALLARVTGIADDAAGEGSVHGLGTTFPHDLGKSDAPEQAIVHTPFADEMVLDAALAALDALPLGQDDVPDLLAIGFNARDYAGHLWGPDSWEALDLTLRLDAVLGRLFGELDRRFGRDGWAIVLTSDHGATPVVDRAKPGNYRVPQTQIAEVADAAIAGKLGKGAWVASVTSSNIYLSRDFAAAPADARGAALDAAVAAVAKLPGIAAVGRVDQMQGHCEAKTGLAQAICLSIVDGESGELYVVPSRGSLITDYKTGTHHDAPFEDNRQVPILVRAPGVRHQTGTGTLLQVAPTVAALLGVPPPPAASAPPLFSIAARR